MQSVAELAQWGAPVQFKARLRGKEYAVRIYVSAPKTGQEQPQLIDVAVGTIQGMGYVLTSGGYSLRLNVSSGVTGQVVGQVWLKGDGNGYRPHVRGLTTAITHLPRRLAAGLNDDTVTASYWQSVPSCDVMTAPQKQSAIDAIATQNQFQTFLRP
jgi:hypothetical protein